MVTLKELKPFYYTALDLGVILSKANLTVIEFSNTLKKISENEKDLIALKYKNDRRKLFLAASYWSYYFVDKEALDAEFPAIKKLLSTKISKFQMTILLPIILIWICFSKVFAYAYFILANRIM